MKILTTGDVFRGKNYADMVNNAIGTNYRGYQQSAVNLDTFGVDGVIAWFVYMDGSVHGYEDGWRWKNYLRNNGSEICEYNVSSSKSELIAKRNDVGYRPFRLAFQIDPYENPYNNGKYCCKFVGAFAFESFIEEDLSAIKYKKIADRFIIGSNGEIVSNINSKETFINSMADYKRKINEFNFSGPIYRMLRSVNITYMYELLELGLGEQSSISTEIRSKLYECFGEKN